MALRHVPVSGVAPEAGLYSHCIAARGEMLFISGQIPVDAAGRLVGPGEAEAHARPNLQNQGSVQAAAGVGYEHLVKLTVFLTDPANAKGWGAARKEFLRPPYPASSAVIVKTLLSPDWLLEVEAIAVVDRE